MKRVSLLISASLSKVEQHREQVGVVHNPVAVGVFRQTAARLTKREQHCEQVGVVHAPVAVDVGATRRLSHQPHAVDRYCTSNATHGSVSASTSTVWNVPEKFQ